jgi:hypothetical protein
VAEAASQAVISFLHDASLATAERESTRVSDAQGEGAGDTPELVTGILAPPAEASPWSSASADGPIVPESSDVRATAAGVATLERIEAAAAKVEKDIAAALQAHAELQAGAGRAAEAAVRAAQEARVAARSAAASESKAHHSLRLIGRYVTITMALLFVAIIILVVTATIVH